jgi:hypothetical protein
MAYRLPTCHYTAENDATTRFFVFISMLSVSAGQLHATRRQSDDRVVHGEVFPNLGYALDQIDHLKRLVIERFEQAAQVGVQVIAANNQQNFGAVAENSASAQLTD